MMDFGSTEVVIRRNRVSALMSLETMNPDSIMEPEASTAAVSILRNLATELEIRVWGGDWCGDCQEILPGFARALREAGIDPESVEQYPVEKNDDGSKTGPLVEEYGIELIPTIIVESDGTEVARFVEDGPEPAATLIAKQLDQSPISEA